MLDWAADDDDSSTRAGPAPSLALSPDPDRHPPHRPPPPHTSACTLAPLRGSCARAGVAAPTAARTQWRFPRPRRTYAARASRYCRAPPLCLRRRLARVCSASRSRSSSSRGRRGLSEFGMGLVTISRFVTTNTMTNFDHLGLCVDFISVPFFFPFQSSSCTMDFHLNPHCILCFHLHISLCPCTYPYIRPLSFLAAP